MVRAQTPSMQGPTESTFRPTVWPAEPPGVPTVERHVLDDLGDGVACLRWPVEERLGRVELPRDFVLQEVLEAPEDDAGLLEFMRQWGPLTDLAPGKSLMNGQYVVGVRQRTAAEHPDRRAEMLVPMDEARYYLRLLRALVEHVILLRSGNEDVDGAWLLNGFHPDNTRQAWFWWQGHMTAALHPFRMHVLLRPGDDSDIAVMLPQPNLFNAAVLQLTQYLGQQGPIARCANEKCQRLFTVQRTGERRRKYQGTEHTSGVRYHHRDCAKAQAERERRRRLRQETGK